MKNCCLILIVILIAGLLLSVSACAEARPPEGKEEGSATDIYDWNLTSDYLYNYENETPIGWAWNTDLRPLDSSDESTPEPAESVKVTQTAGDSSLEGAFSAEYYDDGTFYKNGYWLVYHPTAVKTDGEASYRVDLASEHYWCTVEFTARFMNRRDVSVTPAEEVIECNVGEQISLTEEDVQRIVQADPAVAITSYYLLSPETGEAITETDGYELDWSRFTAKAPGDHPLKLFAALGRNEAITIEAPITMHVISREEADDLWDAAWPPKGKTEGKRTGTNTRRNWNATFFINDDESKPWSSLAPFSLSPDGSGAEQEEITEYHVTFLSGDEHLRGLFYNGQYTEGHAAINMNWRNITEPGTAEFRIDMVSEHYYASEIARPVVVDAKAIKVELLSGDVNVPLGQEVDLAKLYESRAFVVVEPQYEYSCSVSGEEGEIPEETEGYTFSGGVFTAKQAGDYPMVLRVSVGSSGLSKVFPIVIHASADTAEAAVLGDAAISVNALQEAQERLERKKDPEDILTGTEDALFLYRKSEKRSSLALSKFDRQKENREDEYVITGIYPLSDTLIIPASLDENPIVGVERRAISFGGQDNVRSLRIEEGIRSVDGLSNMKNLKEVFLPDSLEKIEMHAFSGDCSLTEIRIPDSITLEDIDLNAFYGIGTENLVLSDGADLMTASVSAYRADGKSAYGIVFTCNWNNFIYLIREDGGAIILDYSGSLPEEGRLVIPEAINGHPVREIGERAFSYQEKLTALVLPEGLESIGEKAFFDCESLTEVRLPSTLKDIGNQAFMGIAANQIELPESARTVSAGWFGGLEKTDATGKWTYRIISDGTAVLTDYQYTKKMVFPAEADGIPVTEIDQPRYSQEASEQIGEVTQVVVPEGVKIIGEGAFANMVKLTKVSLPKGLEQIGRLAFYNCHTMTSVTIPEGVTVIGERAFDLCLKLKSVKLPSTLEEIRSDAFNACPLTSIKLPDALRVIGDRAFYMNKISQWTFPAGVQTIGDEAIIPQDVAIKKITFLGADTKIEGKLLNGSNKKLTITCPKDSAADIYLQQYYPDLKVIRK